MVSACLEIETTRDIAHSKLLGIEVFAFPKNLVPSYADPKRSQWVTHLQ